MPFGVMSGVGLGMGVLDFGGDHQKGRGSLGVNLRHPIIRPVKKQVVGCWHCYLSGARCRFVCGLDFFCFFSFAKEI